jgi:TonB family protein
MLLLIAASVFVWAIVIDRSVRMSKLRPQVSRVSEAAHYPSQDPRPGLATEIMKAGQEASNERRREAVPFTTVGDGRVGGVTLVRSSASDSLDEAASAMLRDARVPPFPALMAQPSITVTVPIHYILER